MIKTTSREQQPTYKSQIVAVHQPCQTERRQ